MRIFHCKRYLSLRVIMLKKNVHDAAKIWYELLRKNGLKIAIVFVNFLCRKEGSCISIQFVFLFYIYFVWKDLNLPKQETIELSITKTLFAFILMIVSLLTLSFREEAHLLFTKLNIKLSWTDKKNTENCCFCEMIWKPFTSLIFKVVF